MLVADQRMPGMAGTDYLVEARKIVPDAKRVLLTAYADTEAAIQAINEVDLDYYLRKPWDPPEEQPVPGRRGPAHDVGARRRARGRRGARHRPPLLEGDARPPRLPRAQPRPGALARRRARQRGARAAPGRGVDDDRLPVALLEDGSVLERPTLLELAERLGITHQPSLEHYDLVIVGGGPAGLAAAVYGASEGLRTILVESEAPGGQAGQSSRIENYLGFPRGLQGSELAQRATDQARRLGAELVTVQDATAVRAEGSGPLRRAQRRRHAQREHGARRLRRLLPLPRRPRLPRVHRRGDLLRRGDDRGAVVRQPARRRSSAARTRRARRRSTSPATRAA